MNELQRDTVVSLLSGHEWFSSLLPDELDELAASAETLYWSRGQIVFEEGEQGNECFLLHTGAVKVVRRFPDGRRVTLARMGPGSVVGELALFNGERRSATVEAVEPTVAVALARRPRDEPAPRRRRGGAERRRWPGRTAAGVERAAVRARAGNRCRPRGRHVAGPGRGQAGPVAGDDGGGDIELVGSSVDVARLAGVPRESASRVLHWLENEGIVTLKRGKTVVHDPDALSRYLS